MEMECNKQEGFFTSDDLFKKVRNIDRTIGVATIYRFLKEKQKLNKIFYYICNRKIVYSNRESNHCHYICEKTGRTVHFNLNNLDFLKEIQSKIPGSINSFQIEIKGVCKDCNK